MKYIKLYQSYICILSILARNTHLLFLYDQVKCWCLSIRLVYSSDFWHGLHICAMDPRNWGTSSDFQGRSGTRVRVCHGSLNVPIEHHPTIRYMVYNGYYKVMSNIPKMGHLPTPVCCQLIIKHQTRFHLILTGENTRLQWTHFGIAQSGLSHPGFPGCQKMTRKSSNWRHLRSMPFWTEQFICTGTYWNLWALRPQSSPSPRGSCTWVPFWHLFDCSGNTETDKNR